MKISLLVLLLSLFGFYAFARTLCQNEKWGEESGKWIKKESLMFVGIILGGLYGFIFILPEPENDRDFISRKLNRCIKEMESEKKTEFFNIGFVCGYILGLCGQKWFFSLLLSCYEKVKPKYLAKKAYLVSFAWMFGLTLSACALLAFMLWFFGI